ncbi:MAG: DNA repair protein RecN, partial [Verrucomicrobiia bacterium]
PCTIILPNPSSNAVASRHAVGSVWPMLELLRIRNLAVLEEVTWEPGPGMNAVTGETGAGKSILIDALLLLLGDRADKGSIREGADHASVEAVFTFSPEQDALLAPLGLESSGEGKLFLKRTVSPQGTRQWINGSPATLQSLRRLGEELIDFHGPHDHQSLLKLDAQRQALDAFASAAKALRAYRDAYQAWRQTETELATLRESGQGDWVARIDFLQFQIREIETAQIRPEEEEEIEQSYRAASSARRILELGASARGLLEEGPGDVLSQLSQIQRLLSEWAKHDPRAHALVELNESLFAQAKDLASAIGHQLDQIELDQERLGELEARLNLLQDLKRKFGPTLPNVLDRLHAMRAERDQLASRETRIASLEQDLATRKQATLQAGDALSKVRRQAAPKLAKLIANELQALGFKKAAFDVRLDPLDEPGPDGIDRVEFFFAPNPGESPKSLRAIASSGEMARVMLAVKTILAAGDRVPILIFDEVDANVGGETAVIVGKKLRALAAAHQVFCITHLPQVAAAAHHHYRVEKIIKDNRTFATVEPSLDQARIDELARMLGGKREASRQLAVELIAEASRPTS